MKESSPKTPSIRDAIRSLVVPPSGGGTVNEAIRSNISTVKGIAAVPPPKGRTTSRHAFTLVELLVVIAIIAILASLLFPAISKGKQRARSIACISNLHQVGIGLDIYLQDHESMLPTCARLPSLETNLPALPSILVPYIGSKDVFRCPADRAMFQKEATSYEWNAFLNGAPYDRPEDWTPVTQGLVEVIFGGRVNTPLAGDAEPFHVPGGDYLGKNALFFDGRVEGARVKW